MEVRFSQMMQSTITFRFDPEYFLKRYIEQEKIIRERINQFKTLDNLQLSIDGSAFYPSIEPFYGSGQLPFLRVADVDSVIDFENCTTIPRVLCEQFPTLHKVQNGDIVLTKGGSVARVGLVLKEAATSRDLIFINSSKLEERDYTFLYVYLQTQFANDLLIRSSSQTTQPHLTLTLVRDIPLFWPSESLRKAVTLCVKTSYLYRNESASLYTQAEDLFLNTLGLQNWLPPQPLTYEQLSSSAFAAGRLDAEFFQPQYLAAREALQSKGAIRFVLLGNLLTDLTNGHTPLHHDLRMGEVLFLGAEHVADFRISYDTEKRILMEHHRSELVRTALREGDVLMTIKGRVGNAALVEKLLGPVNINQDIARLRLNDQLPVWFVLSFLNSRFGKLAVAEHSTGQINPFLGLGNLRQISIPVFYDDLVSSIAQSAEDLVHNAHRKQTEAKKLLAAAKRAVEIAIQESEVAALNFLNTVSYSSANEEV